jgi:hypothetical protein
MISSWEKKLTEKSMEQRLRPLQAENGIDSVFAQSQIFIFSLEIR